MQEFEVSVVMPCLNEETTVGICIEKALNTLRTLGVEGEVVVADNGSTDNSVAIAEKAGARVVHQTDKGYGNAYLRGFSEAKGKYIIMGDADDSYDFTDLERFLTPLREGKDMVMGTRVKGTIIKGAMPAMHRYFGVPALTGFLNMLFRTGLSDAHCGMRSFTKDAYERMHLETTGMEFASEMIIKAKQADLDITEIPIVLHPDGRPGKPHLKSFSDGWRHARFMLNYKPDFLYGLPGWLMVITGFAGILYGIYLEEAAAGSAYSKLNLASASALWALTGNFLLILKMIAKAKNYTGHFERVEKSTVNFFKKFTSGSAIIRGIVSLLTGVIICWIDWTRILSGNEAVTVLGMFFIASGLISMLSAFLLGQMNIFGKE